jgi:hypothetical protein
VHGHEITASLETLIVAANTFATSVAIPRPRGPDGKTTDPEPIAPAVTQAATGISSDSQVPSSGPDAALDDQVGDAQLHGGDPAALSLRLWDTTGAWASGSSQPACTSVSR